MVVDPGVVPLPSGVAGAGVPGVIQPPKKEEVVVKKAGTYVVQAGDTLEKIARKVAPAKTTEMVQKLMSMNGIKDPKGLQVGQTLKMPA
jgi:nucleoid-associated protein YgaU